MEALQKPVTYRGDTGLCRKLMPDKDLCNSGTQDESHYVDLNDLLDMKAEGTKTVKVTFTGEGSQLAIFKCNSDTSASGDRSPGDRELNDKIPNLPTMDCKSNNKERSRDVRTEQCITGDLSGSFETASSSEIPENNDDFKDCPESPIRNVDTAAGPQTQIVPSNFNPKNTVEKEELQYTDMHLSRKMQSDDGVSVVLSDHCVPSSTEDESHYITTHEIQLSELDHDVDYDFGLGSCWDVEDDNLVYSFVDYASFDSDETIEGRQILGERTSARVKSNQVQSNNTDRGATSGAAVSSKHENDLCDSDKCASSDEGLSKNQKGSGNSAGQIHLSIKATSRAINEPSNIQEKENIRYHAKHEGDMSRYVFRDAKAEKICDSAKCFIAAPGRLHFGSKLKGKDFNEYSSGASSAVSELDDADKEVRNLTARAFRSLAYPYFDAINFSTSSESSASEHGLGINRWSTFVDLKYGNMTQGREQNLVSHKSATSTFEIAKNAEGKGIKGLSLANIKAPQTKIFALNGNLSDRQNASSSTKKIELMGKFGQGQSGVITLTETLNFRCNVQAGVPGSDRRAKIAQNAAGSRSTDEVTDTLPSEPGNEASKQPCNAGETMEDTHKKAIFASSLLKNVISKKMQFEQERKMERGEICEPYSALSPCLAHREQDTHKERVMSGESKGLQRQNSKYSEAGSDFTIVCLDELGDIVDTNSNDPKDGSPREDASTLASVTNLESTNEAGFDTKKGAFEASKSTLLRSQNSAFRSWRDGELEFQKEHKNDKTPAGKPPLFTDNLGETDVETKAGSKTKMSHLFVPSIQVLSKEGEVGKAPPNMNYSTRAVTDHGDGGGGKLRSDNTLYVADAARSVVTSKSPEIKISLRSIKENKCNPFNIAKLLTPNIGCNAANLIKTADDSKCQALAASLKGESSEKVPHFMVRDIRENKCKLQTPIHQVRDVRKLVKSSYHFVSLDNNENKANTAVADLHADLKPSKKGPYRNRASLSPIVIKCQSVNTNSNVKQSGNLIEVSKRRPGEDIPEIDRSSPQQPAEGAKNGTILVHRPTGRVPLVTAKQPKGDPSEGSVGVKIETRTAKRKQEKVIDTTEKKPDAKMANQAALEKLKAAVKTMEQLYVFDRNEWKRKTEPQPITDSHVLSLIASEEHGGLGKSESEEELSNIASSAAAGNTERLVRTNSYPNADKSPPTLAAAPASEISPAKEEKDVQKMFHIPYSREDKDVAKPQSHQSGTFSNKSASTVSQTQKAPTNISSTSCKVPQAYTSSQTPFSAKSFTPKSPKVPLSLKISHPKRAVEEREKPNGSEAEKPFLPHLNLSAAADSENYLTIPVKAHPGEAKPAAASSREQTSVYTFTATGAQPQTSSPACHPGQGDSRQSPKRSSIVMETRSPDTPTATIYHHPLPMAMSGAQPQVICFSPSVPPPPSVDHYQQMQRKMLLDPTTGHYYLVDTPVQPATKRLFDPETGQYVDVPMSQQPMAPMPMPISPLALNPGAYGPTYMIYPGFLPTPTMLPSRTMQSQLSMHSEVDGGDKASHTPQQGEVAYMESPYYIPTGKSPQAPPVSQHITTRGSKGFPDGKPVISITSQQGPRIIAPPSFDGTTMSFVVEHR
ncbi:uncharacterized protein C4orf54 homolog [Megalops cyprinoides]|uniref:uncharacterized protein C4orf54 homolog n=1 Tax=Megalops cyprinoides TaxID=118141 RepID=UPI001865167E|nr:uncharacterized protein C4orf54 homolog [Megalops cyprinoides]